MKKGSTLFLKTVIVLIGIAVLAGMLWLPQTEGRNKNSDPISLYFNDPFLVYIYLGTVPFFMALYQAFKLLTHIEQNKTFSQDSVNVLKHIKYCAIAIIVLMAGAMAIVRINAGEDDPAGFLAIGLVVIFATTVIGTFAALLQKLFQNALDIKSENELTV